MNDKTPRTKPKVLISALKPHIIKTGVTINEIGLVT